MFPADGILPTILKPLTSSSLFTINCDKVILLFPDFDTSICLLSVNDVSSIPLTLIVFVVINPSGATILMSSTNSFISSVFSFVYVTITFSSFDGIKLFKLTSATTLKTGPTDVALFVYSVCVPSSFNKISLLLISMSAGFNSSVYNI